MKSHPIEEKEPVLVYPKHLTNEQIIRLLALCYFFVDGYDDLDTHVKIEVHAVGNGFIYKITILVQQDKKVYMGKVAGCGIDNDVEITENQGDWLRELGYPVRAIYEYLDSIGYWATQAQWRENEDITSNWKVIFDQRIPKQIGSIREERKFNPSLN